MRGPRAIPDSEYRWESIQQVAGEMNLKIDPPWSSASTQPAGR
jgi:hypothetical protein